MGNQPLSVAMHAPGSTWRNRATALAASAFRPAIAALAAVLTWLRDDVGLEWAYDRIATLGADFRDRLARVDGVTVVTPAEAMAGLVNFAVAGVAPQEVAARLYERGYTIRYVDYKDEKLLSRFITERGKILPARLSGLSARHQRQVKVAIKRARFLALLPYIKGFNG